jgi:hypothetical protein
VELCAAKAAQARRARQDLQLTLVECLIEFACDLFLSPERCVSNSAGFEKFLQELGVDRNAAALHSRTDARLLQY